MSGTISQQAMKKIVDQVGAHKGVTGALISDSDGLPLYSSDNIIPDSVEAISASIASLVGKVRKVCMEVADEDATSIRVEMEKGDVEIIPDYKSGVTIIALIQRVGAADAAEKSQEPKGTDLFGRPLK